MPSRTDHHTRAASNIAFYKSIDKAQHGDWAVTALFYAALHLADACMAPQYHPADHSERNFFFARFPALRTVHPHYRQLQDDSVQARYVPPTTFDQATVERLARDHFEFIRNSVLALLPTTPDCSAT